MLSIAVPKIISQFGKSLLSSKDAGFKLARIGIGASVAGAGTGAAVSLASNGLADAGKQTSKVFGIDKTILLVVGVILLAIFLIGGKR